MPSTPNIVALVGSRICHDLTSPLGAIGNGVELLEMSGNSGGPEMALIAESVTNANAMVKFFRLAFGAASPEAMVGRSEVVELLSAASRGGKLTYFWAVEGEQPRREVRAVFLILMCFESALPRGGDVHVRRSGSRWELWAEGDRLIVKQPLWDGLAAGVPSDQATPNEVQFALLPDALIELGRRVTLSFGANRIDASF